MGRSLKDLPQGHRKRKDSKKRMQDALCFLHDQPSKSIYSTAKKFNINYTTLRNRATGRHQDARKAHESQQILSHMQEEVLVEWILELSGQCEPISKRIIRKKVEILTGGKKPGISWIRRFLARHPNIKLGKPSGLDPKRAQCFNKTTVTNYFKLLEEVLTNFDIPWENVWNMDEKGCQRGGGRKRSAEKFFVPRNRRPCYRAKSDSLELVTIIECVNATGDAIKPGFVFPGKEFHQGWLEEHNDIRFSGFISL